MHEFGSDDTSGPRAWPWLFGAALAAGTYCAALAWDVSAVRLVCKALPAACLALAVRAAGLRGDARRYARPLAAGLWLSALGDLLLELEDRRLPAGVSAGLSLVGGPFLSGLLAFLCAHLAYMTAFLGTTRRPAPLYGLLGLGYGTAVYASLRPGLGALAVPVAVYALALAALLWRAWACLGSSTRGARSEWLGLAGAVLFVASDTLLGWQRFVEPLFAGRFAVLATYWAAQFCLALSALRAR